MTSRAVAIVGGGPAGATLALGLLRQGVEVTLVTDRTPSEVRAGDVLSSQVTFESALEVEEALGVSSLLPTPAPAVERMVFTLHASDGERSSFDVAMSAPAQSVDQRVKLPAMLAEVERLGGDVVVRKAVVADVEDLATEHRLVVVSTGRGGLAELFEVDEARTPYAGPQRFAALTYLRGGRPDGRFGYHLVEGVGECFTCPALTVDGPCEVVVVSGVPGGGFDVWREVTSPDEHLARLREVLGRHLPEVAARYADAELVDERSVLRGGFTPVVRRPVGTLPSGRTVLGMADAVVLNDPLTSQGSNHAIKSAAFYLDAVLARLAEDDPGGGRFDTAWMERTFDHFWRGWAQFATRWTNDWLRPLAAHQRALLSAAGRLPGIGEAVAAGFDDARLFERWWFDEPSAHAFIAEQRAVAAGPFDTRDLRRALGQYATGVTVVTTLHEGARWAMTANSFTSVSLNPPLVLWAAARTSPSLPAFLAADRFAVNVLAADQHHLSRQFSARGVDRFEGVELADAEGSGPPLIEGTVARFTCRRTRAVEAGDHVVILGEIESYDAPGGEPLVFHSGLYRLATRHPDL